MIGDQKPQLTVSEVSGFDADPLRYLTDLPDLRRTVAQAPLVLLPRESYPNVELPFFPQGSVELLEVLRSHAEFTQADIGVSDDGYRELVQHAGNVFLPIIWVGTQLIFPTTLNVVANYVYDRLKYALPRSKPLVDAHFKVRRTPGTTCLDIRYRGPVESFDAMVRQAFRKGFPDG